MPADRFKLLLHLFTRRFFENDLLAPDIDLRPSAIWVFATMLTPSLMWSVRAVVRYGILSVAGLEIVQTVSLWDKALLMMLAMANAGILTVLTWEALLVDRRDALVLGSLPLEPRVVISAKAAAIARLFLVVAALNLPSVVIFSGAVYGNFGEILVLKAWLAHAVAVLAASLTTSLVLMAALVAVTSLVQGRWLRVMTVAMQILLLVGLTALVLGVQGATTIADAARQGDVALLGWRRYWPPVWFVGLYEAIVRSGPTPVFSALADVAVVSFVLALVAALPITLLLWRRSLRVLVSASSDEAAGRGWSLARYVAPLLARAPLDRALVQFALAVLWRSPRHRLALFTAIGLSAAVVLQGVLTLGVRPPGTIRWLTEFAVPQLVLLCLMVFVRWLLTLPAELPASWALGLVTPARGAVVRAAIGRVLAAFIVMPSMALAAALSWWQGGLLSAGAHATLVMLGGLGMVEYALARMTFMPFATEYLPGRSNLKARWPIHVIVLLFVVPAISGILRRLAGIPGVPFLIVCGAGAAALAWAIAKRHRREDLLTADPGLGVEWRPLELGIGWV